MAGAWLLYVAVAVATVLFVLVALAGWLLVGLFLAAVIVVAAASAVPPGDRTAVLAGVLRRFQAPHA